MRASSIYNRSARVAQSVRERCAEHSMPPQPAPPSSLLPVVHPLPLPGVAYLQRVVVFIYAMMYTCHVRVRVTCMWSGHFVHAPDLLAAILAGFGVLGCRCLLLVILDLLPPPRQLLRRRT
jgi:hypothetical protein